MVGSALQPSCHVLQYSVFPCPWCRDWNWMIPQVPSSTNLSMIPCSHVPRKESTAGFVVQGMLVTQGDKCGRVLDVVEWILIWTTKIKKILKFRSSSLAQECPTTPHHCECPTPNSWIREQHSCCISWYPLSAPPFLFPFSHDGDSAAVTVRNPRIHGLSIQTLSFIFGFVIDSSVTSGKFLLLWSSMAQQI